MKRIAPLVALVTLAAPPAFAQEDSLDELLKRFGGLSEQAQTLLEGWMEEIGPKLDEMGPALESLAQKLGDMSNYHAPEVLENGDIIIRRKSPLPKVEDPKPVDPDHPTIDL